MNTALHISQFFTYKHLTDERLRSMSARFCGAHDAVVRDTPESAAYALRALNTSLINDLPDNPEKAMCLRKLHVALNPGLDLAAQYNVAIEQEVVLRALLEAKDCAVRALVAKDPT